MGGSASNGRASDVTWDPAEPVRLSLAPLSASTYRASGRLLGLGDTIYSIGSVSRLFLSSINGDYCN